MVGSLDSKDDDENDNEDEDERLKNSMWLETFLLTGSEHGIFYLDSHNQASFQHTDDLPSAPTEHLFHLRFEGLGHCELKIRYRVMISLVLSRTLDELKTNQFRWDKPKILKKADKFYNGSSDDSKEV
ncbi:unnamed protein product [Lactuca saligna]|uniref:Uncharacterized protein n=1 Tax=Lactuca saligna TaxID=75948 RepID=A0AA35YMM7_LACSI|nr:unnamed protein product [Lactuca saligna]